MITQVRAKKSLGQHFLKDEGIARRIADSLELSERTPVLEIGPGMGVLTKYLINNPNADFTVVEIDKESVAYLNEHYPELRVIDGDFLKMRLDQVYPDGLCVIGNFPYNISSQIFFKVLEYRDLVPQVVGMIQKEVAERLAEPPGSRTYGILSVLLQAYYDIEYLFTVDENVFAPPPKVKSAVIRLKRNSRKSLDCDEKLFFTVVKTAFNQRRKQLRNSLKPLLPKKDDEAEPKILDYRPEQLGVEDFVELTNYVARRQADNPPDTIDVSDLAGKTLRPAMPAIPYLDADGVERQRYLYTVLTSADADVTYDEYGAENWYVVTNDVIVSGRLDFSGTAHLIVCDGATLAVTNATPNGTAIEAANLTIYGQANGTGNVTATGSFSGIRASGDLAINGGSVTANGGADGISATGLTINGGSVTAIGGDDGIVAHGYAVTINGGSVTANGGRIGILSDTDAVTINGGNVTATGDGYGICAKGNITLGWSDPSDSIFVSDNYSDTGTVSVKAGQFLTDGMAVYRGAVDPDDIAGKTLVPYTTPWKSLQARLNAGGRVTLPEDATAEEDDATLVVTNAVTLDLNGHTIDADGRFCVIRVLEGGDLTLTNGVEESGAIVWNGSAASYVNCYSELTINESSPAVEDPGLVDVANGNYALAKDSPLVNKGADYAAAGGESEFDLSGVQNRIVGSKIDIGCYEASSSAFVIFVR